jgi:hypothetical protein
MIALRVLRIAGIGAVLAYLFHLSHQAGLARGNEEVPGILVAIGVLSLLFFLRALVTELVDEKRSTLQKDFLWGLCAGGVATILIRL